MKTTKKIAVERLREVLDYNPSTGSLTWKINIANHKKAGMPAGGRNSVKTGLRTMKLDGITFCSHIAAWALMTGAFPIKELSFKDGDKSNTKWDNLEEKKSSSMFDYNSKEGKSAHNKYWRERNQEKVRNNNLRINFGISIQEYEVILSEQNGKCAICNCGETAMKNGKPKFLAVDHDHETHEVRGLLCHACNTAIGFLKEKEENFLSAIMYLKKHKSKQQSSNIIPLHSKGAK